MKIIVKVDNTTTIEYPIVDKYFIRQLPYILVFDYLGTTHNYSLKSVKSVRILDNNKTIFEINN